MLKKKRLIILILAFLFTFNSFFYTPKAIENYTLEPTTSIQPREPITLTSGLILAILTFLAACGVAVTSLPMAEDLARRVYDEIKDIPGAITKIGDRIKFNLVAGVLDAIKSVVSSLPSDNVSGKEETNSSLSPITSTEFSIGDFPIGSNLILTVPVEKTFVNKSSIRFYFDVTYADGTVSNVVYILQFPTLTVPAGRYTITYRFVDEFIEHDGKTYQALQFFLYDSSNNFVDDDWRKSFFIEDIPGLSFSNFVIKFSHSGVYSEQISFENAIDIPYSPDTTKDVDYETKPKEWFPSLDNPTYGGSISVPVNQPLPNISVDAPLIDINDFIADNDISIDSVDTELPDNSVDSDSVLDKILSTILGFFTGFWDIFTSLLAGLLAPIISFLDWIYEGVKLVIGFLGDILSAIVDGVISSVKSLSDLLQAILDFLLSLVMSLVDALTLALQELFVPTIDLSEAFSIPENVFVPFHEFEFDDLFSITPKPIRFSTTLTFGTIVYPIKLYFDEISVISDNIGLVRNIFSYTLLLASIYSAIAVFLPKRVMD